MGIIKSDPQFLLVGRGPIPSSRRTSQEEATGVEERRRHRPSNRWPSPPIRCPSASRTPPSNHGSATMATSRSSTTAPPLPGRLPLPLPPLPSSLISSAQEPPPTDPSPTFPTLHPLSDPSLPSSPSTPSLSSPPRISPAAPPRGRSSSSAAATPTRGPLGRPRPGWGCRRTFAATPGTMQCCPFSSSLVPCERPFLFLCCLPHLSSLLIGLGFIRAHDRYKMPVALLGLLVCLFLWELVRFCSDRWHLGERRPGLRQVLIYAAQLGELLIFCWTMQFR